MAAADPSGQNEPVLHRPEQAAVCRPVTEPDVPAGHGVGKLAPNGQYDLKSRKKYQIVTLFTTKMPQYLSIRTCMDVLNVKSKVTCSYPSGHGVSAMEPNGQKEPALHKPEQVASLRPVTDPCVPSGHRIGTSAPSGQYELTMQRLSHNPQNRSTICLHN